MIASQIAPHSSGTTRVKWGGHEMLRALEFADHVMSRPDRELRDAILANYRAVHPEAMSRATKGLGIPTGYYFHASWEKRLRDYLEDPAMIEIAERKLAMSRGYGAALRKAKSLPPAGAVLLKTKILGQELELKLKDLPQLDKVHAELSNEILELRSRVATAEVRANVFKEWAIDKVRTYRELASALLETAPPLMAAPPAKPRRSVRAATTLVEEWRQLPGCSAGYEVSNTGKFRNRNRGRPLTVAIYNNVLQAQGYDHSRATPKARLVNAAKAVAEAFLPPAGDDKILHFRDGNRFNVMVDNLVWIDLLDPRGAEVDFWPRKTPFATHSRIAKMRVPPATRRAISAAQTRINEKRIAA